MALRIRNKQKKQHSQAQINAVFIILAFMIVVVFAGRMQQKLDERKTRKETPEAALDRQLDSIFAADYAGKEITAVDKGLIEFIVLPDEADRELQRAKAEYEFAETYGDDPDVAEERLQEYLRLDEQAQGREGQRRKTYVRNVRFRMDGNRYSAFQMADDDYGHGRFENIVNITREEEGWKEVNEMVRQYRGDPSQKATTFEDLKKEKEQEQEQTNNQ